MKEVVKSALLKKNDFAYRHDTEGYLIFELLEFVEEQQEDICRLVDCLTRGQVDALIASGHWSNLYEKTTETI